MKKDNFIITTTSSLEGYEILEYVDTVSAHIIAGTGLFSDFAGSFSDIFGGRSTSYQKQLEAIEREALKKLEREAKLRKCNAVIGLRIDHDEVSGKAKQMFMVTAAGTAVRVKRRNLEPLESDIESSILTKSSDVNLLIKKKELLTKISSEKIKFTDSIWNFLIENKIYEALETILDIADKELSKPEGEVIDTNFLENTKRYISSLDRDLIISRVYQAFNSNPDLFDYLSELIEENELVDYNQIQSLVNSENIILSRWSLELLKYDKPFYSSDDIENLFKLSKLIEEKYPKIVNIEEKKSMFSGSSKLVWKCGCGHENKEDEIICSKCKKDIYGFEHGEINPPQIIDIIDKRISALKELME